MGTGGPHLAQKHDGLVEYVSRSARTELIQILKDELGSMRAVAKMVDVSAKSVRKWVGKGETHPSNDHLHKILALATDLDQERAFEVLERDLFKHRASLHQLKRRTVG